MPGNQRTERIISTGWVLLGWAALILLSGLATLMLLGKVSHLIVSGPWHDAVATWFVMVVWPIVTLAFRFCIKHGLWRLLGI
jgi:hypothetical protein